MLNYDFMVTLKVVFFAAQQEAQSHGVVTQQNCSQNESTREHVVALTLLLCLLAACSNSVKQV